MSCQSCTKPNSRDAPSDNKFVGCPPRMSDGRHFTDYRPKCYQQYIMGNKLMSSFEQRMYLTSHAEDMMKTNAASAYLNNRCGPCEEPYNIGTMLPEVMSQSCDAKTCTFNVENPYGLGLSRKFIMSDEEKQFRTRFLAEKNKEQEMFKSDVVVPRDTDPFYYPIDGVGATHYDRFAVPSGAVPLTGGQ